MARWLLAESKKTSGGQGQGQAGPRGLEAEDGEDKDGEAWAFTQDFPPHIVGFLQSRIPVPAPRRSVCKN